MSHGCPLSPSCSAICHSHSGVVQNRIKGHDRRVSRFHSVQETRDRWRSNTLVNWEMCGYIHTRKTEVTGPRSAEKHQQKHTSKTPRDEDREN